MASSKRKWGFAAFILILALTALLVLLYPSTGVEVRLRNTGKTRLGSVVVSVTGNSYSIGDLQPGSVASVRVIATGDSHVEVAFQDSTGSKQWLNLDVYFERSYRGTIKAEISKEGVQALSSDFWP